LSSAADLVSFGDMTTTLPYRPATRDMAAPRRSAMPDLSELFRKTILTFLLSHIYQGAGAKDYCARAFQINLVRLVDKALEDYELSRVAFSEYVSRPSNNVWSPLFRAVGHMENCFGSLERALRLARRLAEHEETATAVSGFSILEPAVRKRISKIRNTMEHIDERVIQQQIKEGDLTMLFLSEDAVELQHERIEYSELVAWLRELHDLSTNMATFVAK
jgi:hypothetical protein